jgi:hypothetical protein
MKKEILSYVAGFFDGEGCISIHRQINKYLGYYFRVIIGQSGDRGEQICEWLKANFGGVVHIKKQSWTWEMSSCQACEFLKQIYPYLKIKKDRADIVFEFQKISSRNKSNTHPLDAEKIEKYSYYETVKQEMHFLNSNRAR